MLKSRVLTALVLVPLVVWGVIALPALWFAIVLAAVLAVGAWEWSRLAGFKASWLRAAYVVMVLAGMGLVRVGMSLHERVLLVLLGLVLVWWVFAFVWIARYERRPNVVAGAPRALPRALIGIVALVAPWAALVALAAVSAPGGRVHLGRYLVLFLLLLIWVADSAAYFVGRRWGRRKLAPRVSPGKSWEGVWGALVAALVLGAVAGSVFDMTPRYRVVFGGLCLVTVAFSILGDLVESLLKRQAGLKDSSHLLPGHGGMLDRIDSLTAAAPIFILGLLALGPPQ